MAYNTRGRPRRVATIDLITDPALFYYNRFYEACRTLSYSDCVALSHALGISLRAVYFWRYGRTFPRDIGTALRVMDWVAAGKPIELEYQSQISARL
jgi:hypothetical protein